MITLSQAINCDDYREIIEISVGYARERRPRGSIARLASASSCHPTYVAQVLRGERDFSLEQGLGLAKGLGWSEEVKELFLLHLQQARAGSQELKRYFNIKISQFIEQSLDLTPRERALKGGLDSQYETEYFGDHRYQILHALCLIGTGEKLATLSKKTSIAEKDIEYILGRLERMELIKIEKNLWIGTQHFLHLSKSSPYIRKLHETWLARVLSDLNQQHELDTRYSGLVLLSEKDLVLVREEMVKLINRIRDIASQSNGGRLSVLSLHHYLYNL